MDSETLVDQSIDEGQRLLNELARQDFDVRIAFWVKPVGVDRWLLYIVSPVVDEVGTLTGYQRVLRALRVVEPTRLSGSKITLIGEKDPIAKDILDLRKRHPSPLANHFYDTLLGNLACEEVYVYSKENLKTPHTQLAEDEKHLLERLYSKTSRSIDDLPYTDEMEEIHRCFVQQTGRDMTVSDVFKALKNLGRLGRLGKNRLVS